MAKRKNGEIEKANKELEKLAMNPEEREMYELRIKAIRDEMNIRESGYTDGKADGIKIGETKGIAIGETKGRIEGRIEIAKNMLRKNMQIEDIIEITGLSKEDIEKIEK